jgi:hypothetical protein
MLRAPHITRGQAIALPRTELAVRSEWLVAAVAVALVFAGLLVP